MVVLDYNMDWFNSETGVTNHSREVTYRKQWKSDEKMANTKSRDGLSYSITVVTPAMLDFYENHGPAHLRNWAYAIRNSYAVWEKPPA